MIAVRVESLIYPFYMARIAVLQQDKTLTKVLAKYVNHADVFSFNLVIEQSFINKILIEKLDIVIMVYLDNILINSKDSGQLYVDVI